MTELSLATIDDIVEELRHRKLTFALYVNLLPQYLASGDIPSEKRQEAYGSHGHPVRLACDLCDGIQMALLQITTPETQPESVALSELVQQLQDRLFRLVPRQ
jgi:hypothetical protein